MIMALSGQYLLLAIVLIASARRASLICASE
jgi:hypothetical protein